jgi:hypothetical protein
MYLYVSEIFPLEIRGIGMGKSSSARTLSFPSSIPPLTPPGFSLFGQFAATIILLETAPIGFVNVGWKYYFVIIAWCPIFMLLIYFFWPETARLSLEEISAQFGDVVAVDISGKTVEERGKLDEMLRGRDVVHEGQMGKEKVLVMGHEKEGQGV